MTSPHFVQRQKMSRIWFEISQRTRRNKQDWCSIHSWIWLSAADLGVPRIKIDAENGARHNKWGPGSFFKRWGQNLSPGWIPTLYVLLPPTSPWSIHDCVTTIVTSAYVWTLYPASWFCISLLGCELTLACILTLPYVPVLGCLPVDDLWLVPDFTSVFFWVSPCFGLWSLSGGPQSSVPCIQRLTLHRP